MPSKMEVALHCAKQNKGHFRHGNGWDGLVILYHYETKSIANNAKK